MKYLRLLLSILVMISVPSLVVMAWTNPNVKDFYVMGGAISIVLVTISWFVAETLTGD